MISRSSLLGVAAAVCVPVLGVLVYNRLWPPMERLREGDASAASGETLHEALCRALGECGDVRFTVNKASKSGSYERDNYERIWRADQMGGRPCVSGLGFARPLVIEVARRLSDGQLSEWLTLSLQHTRNAPRCPPFEAGNSEARTRWRLYQNGQDIAEVVYNLARDTRLKDEAQDLWEMAEIGRHATRMEEWQRHSQEALRNPNYCLVGPPPSRRHLPRWSAEADSVGGSGPKKPGQRG